MSASSASPNPLPFPAPQKPERPKPQIVPPAAPIPREPRRGWLWGLGLVALAGVGVWYWMQSAKTDTTGTAGPLVRTATAVPEKIEATLRLAGITGAERFVSLTSPQMRGSRSGFGRDGGGSRASFGGGGSQTVQARSGGNSTLGSSSSAGAGGGGGMSSAMRAAISRSGGGSARSGGASASSRGASTSASSVMGSDGLGTTSGGFQGASGGGGGGGSGMMSMMGGGGGGSMMMSMMGGGGGSGDFAMILQELVPSGTMVKKGQIVAEFDRQNMLLRLDDYKASLAQSEASMRKMYAELEVTQKARMQNIANAKGQLEKAKLDLKTLPVLSAIDSERVRLANEEAEARYKQLQSEIRFYDQSDKAQVRSAELEFEQAKAELRRAEANAERLIIKAPIDGLVVLQTTFRGSEMQQIQNGDQLFPGQLFMTIVDPSSMVVNASVNQVDVERLRIGARARVRFDAFPGLELPGRVYSVGGIPKTGGVRGSFVKEIPVRIKLDRLDPRVIPDLSASVDVIVDADQSSSVVVPLGSIFEDGGKTYVYVQTPGGWQRREVELGIRNFTHVAVKSGLKANEVVSLERPPTPGEKEIPRQTTEDNGGGGQERNGSGAHHRRETRADRADLRFVLLRQRPPLGV